MLSPKYKIQQFALKQVLGYLKKDPEKNLPKIIEWIRKFDTEKIYVDLDRVQFYIPVENGKKVFIGFLKNDTSNKENNAVMELEKVELKE